MAHGDVRAMGVFDDQIINGFIGPGSAAMRIDDFNGNNFDHTGLGFIRGGTIGTSGDGAPVTRADVLPPGVRAWGEEFKEFFTRYYTRTMDLNMQPETLPHRDNRVDLDPRLRDRWGLPLPRVTFDFHQNERRLQKFMAGIGEKIMLATGACKVWTEEKGRPNRWAGGTRWAPIRKIPWSTNIARRTISRIFSWLVRRFFRPWRVTPRPRPWRR